MADSHSSEQQQPASTEPKKRVFERDLLRMATLINDVLMLRRTLERDELYELLLCLFGPFTCEKALETVEHLDAFVAKYCPFVRIDSVVGGGTNEKKFFHWDLTGDGPQKNGLDRMATGTAIRRGTHGEESD